MHAGHLCLEGRASEGFRVFHGDGTPYGKPIHPAKLDAANQALSALMNLGFKATEARALVDAVIRGGGAPEEPAAFLRAALRAN